MKIMRDERGSLAVETVVLVPVLFLLVLFIVSVGRVQSASIAVRHVADVAARMGSQQRSSAAVTRAQNVASSELSKAQNMCSSQGFGASLRKSSEHVSVIVRVHCTVRMTGLFALGLPAPTVRATSQEVIDYYRSNQ